jgi:membrane associated rhomboid family serine protease
MFMPRSSSAPLINIPPLILGLAGFLLGIHALREYSLSDDWNMSVFLNMALIPELILGKPLVFSPAFSLETPALGTVGHTLLTYGFIHGNWQHVFWNSVWLVIFGTPLARELFWGRVLLLFMTGIFLGGIAHLLILGHEGSPLVGASAGIAALTGSCMRLIAVDGGLEGLAFKAANKPRSGRLNLAPLDSPTLVTFSMVWIAMNLFPLLWGQVDQAWYAHLTGYAVGLFFIDLLQPSIKKK